MAHAPVPQFIQRLIISNKHLKGFKEAALLYPLRWNMQLYSVDPVVDTATIRIQRISLTSALQWFMVGLQCYQRRYFFSSVGDGTNNTESQYKIDSFSCLPISGCCSSAWFLHPSTLRCAPPYYSHSIFKLQFSGATTTLAYPYNSSWGCAPPRDDRRSENLQEPLGAKEGRHNHRYTMRSFFENGFTRVPWWNVSASGATSCWICKHKVLRCWGEWLAYY